MERDPFYLCDYFTLSWQNRDSTLALAPYQRVDYSICVFLDHIGPCGGVVVIETGTIDKWMRRTDDIVLVGGAPGRRVIFGKNASEIRSYALLRLKFGPKLPGGLLALGSSDAAGFRPRQGTELIGFLARVLEICVRRWLTAAP